MKVLHLNSEKSWRGGEQQIAYLIEELDKAGVENFVACRKNSSLEQYCIKKQIPFIALPFKGSTDLKTAFSVRNFSNKNGIDIIHLHTSNAHSIGVLAGLFGCNARMILTRRVDFPLKKGFFSRLKYNYHKIKKIICVSDKIKEIVAVEISDPNKVVTIHSGIDIQKFVEVKHYNFLRNKYKVPNDQLLIGNVAAIAPHKDLFTFIKTAEILLKEKINAKFFLVGDGPLKKEVEAFIKEKGLEEDILMTGFLNNIPEILKELDIFLFTSKTEGLGTTILDTFASKTPVISTKAGGIPEMVKHRETGLLCEVGDEKELARAVNELIADPELQKQMVNKAYETVKSFSKETTGKKNLEVYKAILKA